jgi:hypothetical protein
MKRSFGILSTVTMVMMGTIGAAPVKAAGFFGGEGCSGNQKTLGSIINNRCSLDVGDKRFSDFRGALNQNGDSDPDKLNQVLISSVDGSRPGFDISSGFFANTDSFVDLDLTYKVSVLDPAQWLNGVTLAFNGVATGTGLARVTETIFSLSNGLAIGQAVVDTSDPLRSLTDSANFNPVREALINKDILVRGGLDGDASVSFIRNQHNQTNVPTPALLPGLVGMGLTAMRKRRNAGIVPV